MNESLKYENSNNLSTAIDSEMDRYENQITDYVAGLKYEDLTEEAVETAKERYVDSFATALAAYDTAPVKAMRKLALQSYSETGATLLGSHHKAPIDYATVYLGTMIRALDWNDTYLNREPAHPSDNLAACLAVAEAEERNGKDLILEFSKIFKENFWLDERVIQHMESYPKEAHMMDFLLTTLSYARMFDEDYQNTLWQETWSDPDKIGDLMVRTGLRMGAKIPAILAGGYRIQTGKPFIPPEPSLNYAENFLYMLAIEPDREVVEALNTVLTLYLDHTINCSTFTSLVAESSRTDPYSPLLAGGVSLKGIIHGGANELAADMFDEIGQPENAEAYILEKLKNKEIIFGFGHRLKHYKANVESRVTISERVGKALAERNGMSHYFEIYDIITRVMMSEKQRAPNAD